MPQVLSTYKQVSRLPQFIATSGAPEPLRAVSTAAESTNPRPTDFFDGFLWGVDNSTGKISKSSNWGTSWTTVRTTGPAGIQRLMPCSDGELLIMTGSALGKTSGWASDPETATIITKATVTAGGHASFARWGLDGDGTKFILVEYASPQQYWIESQQGLISTDSGDTFNLLYDSATRYGADNANTHIHGACYDRWNDRFWISEGHSTSRGLYFSDDDGSTWTKVASPFSIDQASYPTVLVATEYSIVMGTDWAPNGIWHLPSTDDPENTAAELAYVWQNSANQDGLVGFADRGFYDEETGIVYVSFTTNYAVPCIIAASDGKAAGLVYTASDANTASDRVYNVVANAGKIAAYYVTGGGVTAKHLYAETGRMAAKHPSCVDTGNVLGGTLDNFGSSLAVGYNADADDTTKTVVIGLGASATGAGENNIAIGYTTAVSGGSRVIVIGATLDCNDNDCVVIGGGTSTSGAAQQVVIGLNCAPSSGIGNVAIGAGATCGTEDNTAIGSSTQATTTNTTAIGNSAVATAVTSTAVGASATASNSSSLAVGGSSTASGTSTVAVGVSSSATGTSGTACGAVAVASGAQAVALGVLTTCSHDDSVALGGNTTSTAANQVQIGGRHIEMTEMTAPVAGGANTGRIYMEDNGAGKTRLMVIFPSGAAQQIAIEP